MIGERLKVARYRAKLSTRGLAAKAEVSAMAVSKYERGLDVPGSDVLIRLARALGVKVEFLLRRDSVRLAEASFRCRRTLPAKQKRTVDERRLGDGEHSAGWPRGRPRIQSRRRRRSIRGPS